MLTLLEKQRTRSLLNQAASQLPEGNAARTAIESNRNWLAIRDASGNQLESAGDELKPILTFINDESHSASFRENGGLHPQICTVCGQPGGGYYNPDKPNQVVDARCKDHAR